jgi:hypothetical protein
MVGYYGFISLILRVLGGSNLLPQSRYLTPAYDPVDGAKEITLPIISVYIVVTV